MMIETLMECRCCSSEQTESGRETGWYAYLLAQFCFDCSRHLAKELCAHVQRAQIPGGWAILACMESATNRAAGLVFPASDVYPRGLNASGGTSCISQNCPAISCEAVPNMTPLPISASQEAVVIAIFEPPPPTPKITRLSIMSFLQIFSPKTPKFSESTLGKFTGNRSRNFGGGGGSWLEPCFTGIGSL